MELTVNLDETSAANYERALEIIEVCKNGWHVSSPQKIREHIQRIKEFINKETTDAMTICFWTEMLELAKIIIDGKEQSEFENQEGMDLP